MIAERQTHEFSMGVIEDFIGRYRKEYDFYDQAARLVAQLLEARLQAAGVRAMVTFRAKAVGKLERKVRDRAKRKNYATVENIYTDIPDLAGARVALYFPAQREQVEMVINEIFNVVEKKIFPDMNTPRYEKRFSGYSATHYRVRLREGTLVDSQKRYAEAPVEI
jgi:ppGpp synthetase/RelA/SpoT-type nucleotidyltranferase